MPVAPTFVYPDSTELQLIEQDLVAQMEKDDPVFFTKLFPVENANTYKLEWEQKDSFFGLQQARGLDNQPSPVARIGQTRFSVEPGIYGEYTRIEEAELTRRGEIGKYTGTINVNDLVADAQQMLIQRRQDRQRFLGWRLLTHGEFLVPSPGGEYEHRDKYALEQLTASPAVNNLTTGAPFTFMLSWNLEGRGTSSKFGTGATCYANAETVNTILTNQNPNDLGGRFRITQGNTVNNLEDVNKVLAARGCPSLEIYDETYSTTKNTAHTFVPFIPLGYGVLVGKRTSGTPLGKYRMTVNAHNGFRPGPYTRVVNTFGQDGIRPQDATLEVHDGHNGGPTIQFPSMVKIVRFW